MKYLIASFALLASLSSFASTLPELQGASVDFRCDVINYQVENTFGFSLVEYNKIDIYTFPTGESTMVGVSNDGQEHLLSEVVDDEIRSFEPMRGFFPMMEIMDGRRGLLPRSL